MKKIIFLLTSFIFIYGKDVNAQPGKNGAFTVTATNTIVNEYTTLTANASAGSTTITVANSALNSNGRFTSPLSQGDLIMIIQMQGATIEGTLQPPPGNPIGLPNDSTWGSVTNYNNAGNNEITQVTGVPNGTTINVSCGLKNNYTAAGKVQIVRIPRYSSLTINSGGVLTCTPWNSKIGGIVAVEVSGNTTINTGGQINTTGLGFRGGLLPNDTSLVYGIVLFACQTSNVGGSKGEGIAGYASDYNPNGGRYCRGAAANAGGGSNTWNCGGGGGANGGNISQWSGKGNPDTNPSYTSAWDLEYPSFSTYTSSGGGRGGYSWSSSNQNPLTIGPGNSAWGGDYRKPNGGLGGRPLDYSTGRLFLGGGGGSGNQDNNFGGAGANGGGLVYILSYGQVLGGGEIITDGANGGNAQGTPTATGFAGNDGAGGAGGGGTVVVNSIGSIASGITIHADGGSGGNQVISKGAFYFGSVNEAEGPGGGGGGGYIALSNAVTTETVAGGVNGTTNSSPFTSFPPNGATIGGAGITSLVSTYLITAKDTTICSGSSVTLTATVTGTLPPGTSVAWFTSTGTEITTGLTYTPSPALTTTTTFYVGSCPGSNMVPVTVTVTPAANTAITPAGPFCISSPSVNLTAATGGGIWSGMGITNSANGTFNPATAGVGSHIITYTISGPCGGSSTATIVVNASANTTITPTGPFCTSSPSINLTAATGGGIWSGTGITNSSNGTFNPSTAGVGSHIIKYVISGACADSSTITIVVDTVPNTTINPAGPFCVSASAVNLTAATGGGIWSGTGITNSTNGTFNPATAGVGSYVIKYVISGTCPDSSTITIVVNASANTTITPAGPFCADASSVNLTAASGGGIWSGTGITNSSNGTFDPATAGAGSYVIKYVISGACADSSTTTIVVNAVPNTAINAVGNLCTNGSPINLTAATNGGVWSGIGITNSSTGVFDPTVSGAGTFTIKYVIGGSCPDSSTVTITVNQTPVVTFSATPTSGCAPVCVNFTDNSTGSCSTINWTFGDGNSSTSTNPLHCYTTSGAYDVTMTCNNNGCIGSNTINSMITVNPTPIASFTMNPSGDILPNTTVNFTNTSTSGSSITWNFGDPLSGIQNGSILSAPTHTYADTGSYCVTLIAQEAGCTDSVQKCFEVFSQISIVVPNTFTPNGDGKNDLFFIKTTGIASLTCDIFDRWGVKVYTLEGIGGTWNGTTNKGAKASSGTYYYVLNATGINGTTKQERGFIELIR